MIATVTANRAAKLKTMTNTPTVTLRLKVIGPTNEEIHLVATNPFYKEPEGAKQMAKKVGRAFKQSTKKLGEVMSEIGEAAGQSTLVELGDHTQEQSKRMMAKKKDTARYTVNTKPLLK